MKRTNWIILLFSLLVLIVGMAAVLSCGDDDDDDDDSGTEDDDSSDDDITDDDDDSSGFDSLTWENPSNSGLVDWQEAMDYCNELVLDGYDDWRSPTISELRSLIRGCPQTELGGVCAVTDNCLNLSCGHNDCSGCDELSGPGQYGFYQPDDFPPDEVSFWSSKKVENDSGNAWTVDFYDASIDASTATLGSGHYARCVRP